MRRLQCSLVWRALCCLGHGADSVGCKFRLSVLGALKLEDVIGGRWQAMLSSHFGRLLLALCMA